MGKTRKWHHLFKNPVLLLYLIGLIILPSARGDLRADGEALLAFLEGLQVAPARVKNWSNATSPCSWFGVACNAAQDSVNNLTLPGNGLIGSIQPSTLSLLNHLQVLSLRSNYLSGLLPFDLINCTQLKRVSLQGNRFSGPLPRFNAADTPFLSTLDLSFNHFAGEIPPSFSSLNLHVLRLQNNSLSGSIPHDLSGRFRDLNLSNNNLSGSIPSALQNLSIASFSGNPLLCGPPLAPCESPPPTTSIPPSSNTGGANDSSKKLNTLDTVLLIVAGVAAILLLIACCLIYFLRRHVNTLAHSTPSLASGIGGDKNKDIAKGTQGSDDSKEEYSSAQEPEHNKLVFFPGGQLNFDLEELLRASAEVLGKGSFGTAYKAVLEDGVMVVVKRLREVSIGRKEFEQNMGFVGRLQHPNLVPLRAYYFSKEEKLLVHDYYPLGSLSSLLHGKLLDHKSLNRTLSLQALKALKQLLFAGAKKTVLDWETRLKIAMGAARGLAFIHDTNGKAVHGDIKSANVLLKSEYDACLSDYGLVSLSAANICLGRSGPPAIAAYRAPELDTRKPTQTSDVYSYGVVLLELLTGKAPWQSSTEEGMELVRWVQSVVREEWTSEVFDKQLMKYQHIEEEMVQLLQLGLACVVPSPEQRPSMLQVVSTIYNVRPSLQDVDAISSDQFLQEQGFPMTSADQSSHESPTTESTSLPPTSSVSTQPST
ncbi:hypothetical protein L7F22_011143 [Adiantum nelumboides]|nr:hypothetical protein [Adiantum nelumboides]